jgi:hypothetical protein
VKCGKLSKGDGDFTLERQEGSKDAEVIGFPSKAFKSQLNEL